MKKLIVVSVISLILISHSLMTGCGYTLEGQATLLPPYIFKVGIPTFGNRTTNPTLSELLSAEVYTEFLSRGKFELTESASGVDAVLEGEIIYYVLVPRAIDEEGIATQFLVVISADVVFRDLIEDKILWEQKNYRFQSEYQLSDVGSDFVTQELESVRLAAKDFAKSLVSSILTGF